jgi:predicted regulator of Ras-like GTPase activity (Roadblock/LC7/MglB family)
VADDIRTLSAVLARDPSSLQYVDLAESLRKRGNLAEALQVATHGLGRHPEHADGYDSLARIHSDKGDLAEARAAWERALAIVPEHPGALKGIGFLFFRQGDTNRALETLEHALAASPGDEPLRRALAVLKGEPTRPAPNPEQHAMASRATVPSVPSLRTQTDVPQLRATAASIRAQLEADKIVAASGAPSAPPPPAPTAGRATVAREMAGANAAPAGATPPPAPARPPVFAGLEGATADMLLLDAQGLVMAGGLRAGDGHDVSELAAAALAGVSGEASRTSGYLKLGSWSVIVAEAESGNVVLAPVGEGALLMLRREKSTPVGLALRIAERARKAAAQWLEAQAP